MEKPEFVVVHRKRTTYPWQFDVKAMWFAADGRTPVKSLPLLRALCEEDAFMYRFEFATGVRDYLKFLTPPLC